MGSELTERVSSEVVVHQPAFTPFVMCADRSDKERAAHAKLILGTEADSQILEEASDACAKLCAQNGQEEGGEEESQVHDPICSQVAHATHKHPATIATISVLWPSSLRSAD